MSYSACQIGPVRAQGRWQPPEAPRGAVSMMSILPAPPPPPPPGSWLRRQQTQFKCNNVYLSCPTPRGYNTIRRQQQDQSTNPGHAAPRPTFLAYPRSSCFWMCSATVASVPMPWCSIWDMRSRSTRRGGGAVRLWWPVKRARVSRPCAAQHSRAQERPAQRGAALSLKPQTLKP
jgi:hypothetical protein